MFAFKNCMKLTVSGRNNFFMTFLNNLDQNEMFYFTILSDQDIFFRLSTAMKIYACFCDKIHTEFFAEINFDSISKIFIP